MTLKVDESIPCGNVCDVQVREGAGIAQVEFAAASHGGPESLWFCFRVSEEAVSGGSPRKMKLIMKHVGNVLGGSRPENVRPVLRAADGDWERLDPPEVEDLPDGRVRLLWVVDAPVSFVDVAFCYPYGPDDVDELVARGSGVWKADTIGLSQGHRPLIRLCSDYGTEGGQRPGVYLIARQHSGETPGSWVLDGFLRHVASAGECAPLVWAVPLSNIDGVVQGDYGKDNFPYDLNRAWDAPPMRHETLVIQRDFARWKERCRPALAMDFHAPGGTESGGIYAYVPDAEEFPEWHRRVSEWVEAVRTGLTPRYADEDFDRVARYRSRWETPSFTRFCWTEHEIPAFTLETPYALAGELVLTRRHYREAGRRIASAVIETLNTGGEPTIVEGA